MCFIELSHKVTLSGHIDSETARVAQWVR